MTATAKKAIVVSRITVPRYSQFDVRNEKLQDVAGDIAALKTVMDFLGAETPDIDTLINVGTGIKNAYSPDLGWSHRGLVDIAKHYGLLGASVDLHGKDPVIALRELKGYVKRAPCLVSVRDYAGSNKSEHLIVVTSIHGMRIICRDPRSRNPKTIRKLISVDYFLATWKRRVVIIRKI